MSGKVTITIFVAFAAIGTSTSFTQKNFKNVNLVHFVNESARAFRDDLKRSPLEFAETTEIAITNSDYVLEGAISDVTYPGLSEMRAYYINADLIYNKLHIEANFPSGDYVGKFNLSGRTIRNETKFGGVGTFTLTPSGGAMWFSHNMKLDLIDGFIVYKEPNAYLGDSSFVSINVSGFFDGAEDLISETVRTKILRDLGENLRDTYRAKVQQFLRNEFMSHLQNDFNQLSLDNILAGVTLPRCSYNLKEALIKWGQELVFLQENETMLSSNVVGVENGQVVMEIITKKRVVISSS